MAKFTGLTRDVEQKLWPHQARALKFAISHLKKRKTPCLIRMPTGTGKTGVIGCLTRVSNAGTSLVLTPWANLREQMAQHLSNDGFFRERGIKPNTAIVEELLPSIAHRVLADSRPKVVCSTFTTLNEIRRGDEATYRKLARAIDLVIVDECHYEPAVEWKKSVGGLGVRTVLLTATPYRNDLKLFRISDPRNSTHHFTHEEAVQKGIIRKPEFQTLPPGNNIRELAGGFAEQWSRVKRAGALPVSDPRAIVCCSGAEEIEIVVNELNAIGLSAIGIHEQFGGKKGKPKKKNKHLRKDVPRPLEEAAEIWVHQHKLTEGLDDHRFCCVALLTEIRNGRKLIQQIGRVLRRKPADGRATAIVMAPSHFSAARNWQAYLEFETDLKLLDPQHFRDVVTQILRLQPAAEYFDGRFRRRFDPSVLGKDSQVIIPPSVLVRRALRDFSLDAYISDCTDTLNTKDAVILGQNLNGPCKRSAEFALWVYASVRNARSLHETSLYEVQLETHCVVLENGYVLITDSRGLFPEEYLDDYTAGVERKQLSRFIDRSFSPTHVSIQSSIPYGTVVRGADLYGEDLLKIPSSLTDRVQICRAIRGESDRAGRRYIGLNRGRLRQEETAVQRNKYSLDTFLNWARKVAGIVDSNVASNELFRRYMPACAPPPKPIPKTICIDVLRLNPEIEGADGHPCSVRTLSANVALDGDVDDPTYRFRLEVSATGGGPEELTMRVRYEPKKQRFWFSRGEGPTVLVRNRGDDESAAKNIVDFLNQNQDAVLIGLDGGRVVYQGREFYEIDYSYAEQTLLTLIERPLTAKKYRTEKGTKAQIAEAKRVKASEFPEGALFRGLMDRDFKLPLKDELVICADLGTECCDFLVGSLEQRQLALVHMKTGGGQKVSATAFQEVVAQAMKNLAYLTRNAEAPKGVESWRPASLWNKTGVSKICRPGDGDVFGSALWQKLKSEILYDSNPQLFVILVTTGCCDLDELTAAVTDRAKRTPEVAQLLHLLDGLHGHARQLGVRLVIYDLPFDRNEATSVLM